VSAGPRLLYLVTEDWYFCSHRLPLGIAARARGYDVTVATRVQRHAKVIEAAGLKLAPLQWSRHGHNPFKELSALREIIGVYRRERPDIVHHVAVKPVLYGSIAARLTNIPAVVNAIAGLGYLESSNDLRARILGRIVETGYRLLLDRPNSRLIVQNPDDLSVLVERGIIDAGRVVLIRGAGVDVSRFTPAAEPDGTRLVVLPARLLRDKGVFEYVEAARRLRAEGVEARFALVGEPDSRHPAAISRADLGRWEMERVVECWGWRDDMVEVFKRCHVVCLPSYREGMPKALLEAAACGRAIVTCDVPGCREVVRDGDNGLLVPPRDSASLAVALKLLLQDDALRQRMARRSRERAVEEFSVEKVVADTLGVYQECLVR
jgi:glycosyltransferase involved in cell wall biosynthesis